MSHSNTQHSYSLGDVVVESRPDGTTWRHEITALLGCDDTAFQPGDGPWVEACPIEGGGVFPIAFPAKLLWTDDKWHLRLEKDGRS
jgi:hypothetical protein